MEGNAGQLTEPGCDGPEASREDADEPGARFSIGDIAREFGLSLRALRFYEDRGLLHPCRRGTTRFYSDRDRAYLQLILKGKQLGFTLRGIREMLTRCADTTEPLELQLNLNPEQIVAQIHQLERQRADLDLALCELKAAHQRTQASGPMTAA